MQDAREMNTPTPSADEYATSDLGVAAFLAARDFPLLRVEPGDRAKFVFPGPAKKTADAFWLPGSNLVDARKFHRLLRDLRGVARGERR